jgi:glycosyltransferase involved in cell wall biosynthesis
VSGERLRVGVLASAIGGDGGIARFTRELLRELGRRSDLELVIMVPADQRDAVGALGAANVSLVVPIRGRGQIGRSAFERYRMGRVLQRIGVDVVHGTKHLLPRTRLPTVLTVQDVTLLAWPEQFGMMKRLLLPRQFAASLREATVLVAASETTAARLVHLDPEYATKTVVAPNGISVELLDARSRAPAAPPSGSFALVVGDLSPRKNMSMLLDIWPDVAGRAGGLRLVAVGPEGWRSEGTRRRLEALEAEGFATWAHHVPDEELRWYYEHAAMVLVPSHEEGFGLPVVEALALGANVIASTDPALVEVARGLAVHVPADDERAWIDAIVDLAAQTHRPQPSPVFTTWSEHAARTVEAYRLAVEHGRA